MQTTTTILIVDDEPVGRETLEALLITQGYELVFAGDGPEALAQAQTHTPDLILLDVMMPGMDGFEVCRQLRADSRLAKVPVIMVTALDDRDSRLRGIEAGADDFVTKPYDRAELRARVRTVTRLNRYRRLLAERAKFEWAVDQSTDGYLMVNAEDVIQYSNPQARVYLSLPLDEAQPAKTGFLAAAQSQYHCEPQEAWANWPASPQVLQPRYLVQPESPTAKAFWLQADLLELPFGDEAGRVVRLRDVTLAMTLQRDVWEFHALVSHKLRTPLGIMLGSLELASQDSESMSSVEIVQLTKMALSGARRLDTEVRDILLYLETPGLAQAGAEATVHAIKPLIEKVTGALKLESVVLNVQESLDNPRLTLSISGLEMVLWEILENALKFHPEQSPAIEINVSRSSAEVMLRFADDGLTLTPSQLARVWMPYYQAEKFFTGAVTGMGLGLSMVASLVWSVGGRCNIANREGGPGVVVQIALPIASS